MCSMHPLAMVTQQLYSTVCVLTLSLEKSKWKVEIDMKKNSYGLG